MRPDFEVRSFYRDNYGDERDGMAIWTWHVGEASRDIEIAASKARRARGEIARIEWRDVRRGAEDLSWRKV
jgi:hypothetical protein